ncbi:Structural maintenance of chromosomes protein 1A [Anthophora quadrimaculata]
MYFFELFHIKEDIQDLEDTLEAVQLELNEYEKENNIATESLKECKNQLTAATKNLDDTEQDLAKVENDLKKKETNLTQITEKALYWEQKISSMNLSLVEAQKSYNSHMKTIEELENELTEMEHIKTMFEENMATQILSQGSTVALNDIQVKEYLRLKQIVEVQSFENTQACNALKCQQSINQNKLDNENRKKFELEIKLQKMNILKDETEKRCRCIQQRISEIEGTLTDKISTKNNLESLVTKQREDREAVQQELQNVSEQLENVKVNKFTNLRFNKEKETVNILQDFFSGVYGRLYNLCKPIHSRYNVAMIKAFGKYYKSIIVSTNKVAVQCINYLKEQQIGIETFLPLENLKIIPMQEELRRITNLQDVRLLYDIVQFAPAEIHNAVAFVCKNTIVCETSEDARVLAYEIDPYRKYNCVSLDGTYYRKDGLISGGQTELLQKVKMWDQENLIKLKTEKAMLMEKLQKSLTISQTETEINTLHVQIRGLTNRLNYCRLDLAECASENKIGTLHNEIQIIQNELALVENNICAITEIMEEEKQNIEDIKKSVMNIEDKVFKKFCRNVGIRDIRQYEQENLKLYEEQTIKKLELEEQYSRIKHLLDYEKSRDTESLIFKIEEKIKIAKEELEKVRKSEALYRSDTEHVLNILNNLKAVHNEAKLNMTKQTNDFHECRRKLSVIAKSLINSEKKIIIIATKIKKKKTTCHDILKNMKIENITIPLLTNDAINNYEDVQTSYTSHTTTSSKELYDIEILSHIDFRMLPEDIKIREEEEINNLKSKFVNTIEELQKKICSIENPDFKANEHLQFVIEKLNKINVEYQKAHKNINMIKRTFEIVKQERYNRFVACLEHITAKLDIIYKCLVRDNLAQAILLPENHEEPYLDGLNYSCIMPGKRFQSFLNLSGGEKTLAALAFLFAIHSFRPAPFFVLDEIDAALDTINLRNVVHFVLSKKREIQFIIISLKQELCSHAEALVGISCDNNGEYPESLVYTLSLENYPGSDKK